MAGLPPEAEPYAKLRDVVREGAFAVVRLTLAKPRMARLAPQGEEWVLTLGEGHSSALQPLTVNRNVASSTVVGLVGVAVSVGAGGGVRSIRQV